MVTRVVGSESNYKVSNIVIIIYIIIFITKHYLHQGVLLFVTFLAVDGMMQDDDVSAAFFLCSSA